MTDAHTSDPQATASGSALIRIAIWVAIGALIAAAIVCVVWVLVGTQNGLVGRAFLTILLLAAFAGVAILDAHLAARRPPWFALTSMIVWVVTLLIGAFLIWMPEREFGFSLGYSRFASFLLIVLILQLALLHLRLYVKAYERFATPFTMIVMIVTIGLVAILAFMLVFALAFSEYFSFTDLYWRWVVAFAILAAVGTALIPLVNALFAPKKPRPLPAAAPYGYAQAPAWPTYADGVTPLPMLADGSPDWTAYYTGYPSAGSQALVPIAPVATPSAGWDPQQQATAWPDASQQQAWVDPAQQQAWVNPAQQQAWVNPAQQQTWIDPAQQQTWVDPVQQQTWVDPAQQQAWVDPAQRQTWVDPAQQAWNELAQQNGWAGSAGQQAQEDPDAQPTAPMPPTPSGYEGYPPPPPLPPRP